MRTFIPTKAECYPFLIKISGIFGVKRNIGNTFENIKYSSLKKNRVIYHNKGKRATI